MQAMFSALSLADQKAMLSTLRAEYSANRAQAKAMREAVKTAKAVTKAQKQADAIAKAQARLDKLLAKQAAPVGAKALKANRKPGKVVTYGAEDNAIAAAIMAKKASA
jgi:hypothetical protein